MHFIASFFFVVYLDLGILGTGYSSACSFFVTFLALIYFSFKQKDIRETMVWPDTRIFLGLKEYLYIAIPSMLMIFLDWWVWELMILLSGYLSVAEQAAQIVLMNIKSFLYMFGLGMEQASCAILGQQIGKGNNIKSSKKYLQYMKEVSLVILVVNSLIMYIYQDVILRSFTANE